MAAITARPTPTATPMIVASDVFLAGGLEEAVAALTGRDVGAGFVVGNVTVSVRLLKCATLGVGLVV